MVQLLCPVCGSRLNILNRSYVCDRKHCYDISKCGYVNLLPSSGHGKRHGDDKLMVKARTEFLNHGYYNQLSDEICRIVEKHTSASPLIIDAGCGEGKYTSDIYSHLESKGITPDVLGIDISKDALVYAAKRNKHLTLAVASTSCIPIEQGSADFIINIFSPFMNEEFRRVLKQGGIMIRVFPLKYHLWELKQAVYDTPYTNDDTEIECHGFDILYKSDVCYSIHLTNNEDIQSLFKMTPYYYKTGINDQKKLDSLTKLTTKLEFEIVVYSRL